MRTSEITLNGVTYPLCFSTWVMTELEDRGETASDAMTQISEGNVSIKMDMLHMLMKAGNAYAKMNQMEAPQVPSLEDLKLTTCIDDFGAINTAIVQTVLAGTAQTIEVDDPKKDGGAPQAE